MPACLDNGTLLNVNLGGCVPVTILDGLLISPSR